MPLRSGMVGFSGEVFSVRVSYSNSRLVHRGGSIGIRDGQYILHSHGKLIRTITEQEYHLAQANEARGFSGHWIAFYGIAMVIWYPFWRGKREV